MPLGSQRGRPWGPSSFPHPPPPVRPKLSKGRLSGLHSDPSGDLFYPPCPPPPEVWQAVVWTLVPALRLRTHQRGRLCAGHREGVQGVGLAGPGLASGGCSVPRPGSGLSLLYFSVVKFVLLAGASMRGEWGDKQLGQNCVGASQPGRPQGPGGCQLPCSIPARSSVSEVPGLERSHSTAEVQPLLRHPQPSPGSGRLLLPGRRGGRAHAGRTSVMSTGPWPFLASRPLWSQRERPPLAPAQLASLKPQCRVDWPSSSAWLLSRACPLGALAKASPSTLSPGDPCPSKPVCPHTFPSSLGLPGALLWDPSSGSEAPG